MRSPLVPPKPFLGHNLGALLFPRSVQIEQHLRSPLKALPSTYVTAPLRGGMGGFLRALKGKFHAAALLIIH